MDAITGFLILVLVAILIIHKLLANSGGLEAIPGPRRYPFVGTWEAAPNKIHLQFTEWAKQYGPVFRINIITQPAVVLNSYDTIREALFSKSAEFSGRPAMHRADRLMLSQGVGFQTSNDCHKQLRKTGLRALKPGGSWGTHLDHVICDHLGDLVNIFEAKDGQSFNPKREIHHFLSNIILTLLFGERFDNEDPLLDALKDFNAAAMKAMTLGRENQDQFPNASRWLDPSYKDVERAIELRREVVEPLYRNHKETYTTGQERGIMDFVIADVQNKLISDDNAIGVLLDYLIAGVETTATVMTGLFLVLLSSQYVQKKLQDEVDLIVGKDRSPSLSDKCRMPYAEATVLELLRYMTPIPVYLPHCTTTDTTVAGFSLPKDTCVLVNAWAVNHNPEIYEEPFSFKPERFVDENGKLVPADHPVRRNVLSFGLGSRHCPGEVLAKNRLFLTVATLMQRFTFVEDVESPAPSSDVRGYKLRIIFDVADYKIKAVRRS